MSDEPKEPPTTDEPAQDAGSEEDAFSTTSDVQQLVVPRVGGDATATTFGYALALTALVSVAFHFALTTEMRARNAPFAALGAIYAMFAILAVLRFKNARNLRQLRPKGGDVTLATIVAGLLWGLGYASSKLVMGAGTPREGWLVNVYLLLGNPAEPSHHTASIALFFIGGAEEIAWRGLVLDSLEGRLGPLRASVVTAALWAVAHVPTLYRLGDPLCGYNPLLVAGAFGCGLVWAYLRYRTGRLAPAVISHAIFSWAIVEFPLWKLTTA
ncbi:MAG: type II CAAX endopeptidase family protein [Polyangiaceae bacterium]